MAQQDFDINIRTLADTTGIKLTQAQLEALQRASIEGNQKAVQALKQLSDAQKQAQGGLGFGGSAVGVGTIISLVTGAISKWKAFNDEQDKMVESMIRAEDKMRALGESILDMQDKAISARRVGTEPLEQSFVRLQQEIIRLKTEQSLLDLPSQGEEWKKLNAEIGVNESQLHGVTSAMQKQQDEAAKAKEKLTDKTAKYIEGADPQVKAILANEAAMFGARAAGRDQDAAMFERSALGLRAGARPDQLAEVEKIYSGKEVVDAIKELGRNQRELIDLWK